MGVEIERKFLVTGDGWRSDVKGDLYHQGYIGKGPGHAVRVRIAGDKACMTIKSGTLPGSPLSRMEFEYSIPVPDAEQLLQKLCEPGQIRKIRYRIPFAGFVWEVDEFLGDNEGLVIAEIELASEEQSFERPLWIGQEVSLDPRYSNARLAQTPYSVWKNS